MQKLSSESSSFCTSRDILYVHPAYKSCMSYYQVINHKPYDHRADVFSFAIVLWELVTSKIPYENLTPLQAALGVRQGMRLEIPPSVHPQLSKMIQRCWDENPNMRPSFAEITAELEDMLQHLQASKGTNRHSKAKVHKKVQR